MGYNLLINGIYWDYNPLILTIDPNFVGHPRRKFPKNATECFLLDIACLRKCNPA